jgi:hypothetical protein
MRGKNRIAYEEIELPFEKLYHDSLDGDELIDAVESSLEETSAYTIHRKSAGVKAYRGSWLSYLLRPEKTPALEFDISESEQYSHLTAELRAPSKYDLELLKEDLEALESNMETYIG